MVRANDHKKKRGMCALCKQVLRNRGHKQRAKLSTTFSCYANEHGNIIGAYSKGA